MKYKLFTGALLILIVLFQSLGCKPSGLAEVTFDRLFANSDSFNKKEIILEGYYFSGFEVQVIAEELKLSGYAEDHLVPTGKMIWIDGGIPIDIYNRMNKQSMMGPEERFGKIKITGTFAYGGQYGHLGGYDSQITTIKVELLEWIPNEH